MHVIDKYNEMLQIVNPTEAFTWLVSVQSVERQLFLRYSDN